METKCLLPPTRTSIPTIFIPAYCLLLICVLHASGQDRAQWRCTTNSDRWVEKTDPEIVPKSDWGRRIDIDMNKEYQVIDGFGGCFNEMGWDAMSVLSDTDREELLRELFDTTEGCKFNICRMPIGSSDFAMGYYSLNDNDGDYAMEHFSIDRDKERLIPFIKGAMKYNPGLKMWGSPWSPPEWMKDNHNYSSGKLTWTAQNLDAYALYLEKAALAYRAEGLNFYMVSFQNEPYADQAFPSCLWSGTEMRDFVKNHLGPRFTAGAVPVELWLPTMNNGSYSDCIAPTFNDPEAGKYITGVGFQWAGEGAIGETHQKHPDKKLMLTETNCGDGSNDWNYADYTFDQFHLYISNGANAYMQWNMVLDEKTQSWWGWPQCSMITINRNEKRVIYNPQHHLAKHFSYYIRPGAHRIESSGGDYSDQLVFKNPNDDIVAVVKNGSFDNISLALRFGNQMITPTIPAQSFNTFLISPAAPQTLSMPRAIEHHRGGLLQVRSDRSAIEIHCNGTAVGRVLVSQMDGKTVWSESGTWPRQYSVSITHLPAGMYVVSLESEKVRAAKRCMIQ
jgi:glucosylceramidase